MVSVIIPSYNHAPYLEQRIESVLSQTWQHFEVIILDDCSTDNSRQIIEKYRGHQKVTSILYNPVNTGNTFIQWVKGIKVASAEFVWIAESDDWCEPSFLENIVGEMTREPQCVVGFCQSFCINGRNSISWKSGHPYLNDRLEGAEFIKKYMLLDTAIFNASMAVWRRSAFSNITGEFTTYKYCGDWLFWIELCRQGNVFISGKLLNYFRKHDNDVSGNATRTGENFKEEVRMFRLLLERGWISPDEFMGCLRKEFIHYKAVQKSFTKQTNKQINDVFFADPVTKSTLNSYYNSFYLRSAVKKIIRKFAGW